MFRSIAWPGLVCVTFLVMGCAAGPDYERPAVNVPEGWRVGPQRGADAAAPVPVVPSETSHAEGPAASNVPRDQPAATREAPTGSDRPAAAVIADAEWWKRFGDPLLDQYIATALEQNRDLRIAAGRVQEYVYKLQIARADFYPQVQSVFSLAREQLSEVTTLPLSPRKDRINDNYELNVNISWEVDAWGRIRRASEAARADLLALQEARRAVILTLVSQVATGYFTLLKLDGQLANANTAVEARRESLRLATIKFKGGRISQFELAQVQSLYEEAAARIPSISREIALQENLLSVLLARNPAPVKRERDLSAVTLPIVPEGVPSLVLNRRPDILQREQELIAANARIGVAKANYFPILSLTGLYGSASAGVADFLTSGSTIWSIGPRILASIFSGGRTSGEVGATEAVREQLLETYLATIQTAFREVNDALASHILFKEQHETQQRWVKALQEYARLAHVRYENGYSSYLEVLDAERTLSNAQNSMIQTQLDIFTSLVDIYKALGGGWTGQTEPDTGRAGADAKSSLKAK